MVIFEFERFCENLKNGSIDFFEPTKDASHHFLFATDRKREGYLIESNTVSVLRSCDYQ